MLFLRTLRSSSAWGSKASACGRPALLRSYQSYDSPKPPSFSPAETAILSAALRHVPRDGFTTEALTAGARDAGYLDISSNLFPDGPVSLIKYHLVTERQALSNHFPSPYTASSSSEDEASKKTSSATSTGVPAKIRRLALHRLRANAPIIQHWQSALAILSLPKNISLSLRELALLSDEILFLAGSKTVTGAWYTDRAGLAALYASAEVFMTTDESRGFAETERFVERRLEEASQTRDSASMVGRWVGGQFGALVDGLRSKGVWI